MLFERPSIDELLNESDVEQKFIYPLLVGERPSGLGIPSSNILTKASIRRLAIDKRQKTKLYYPDYLIVMGGLPLAVFEAKPIGDDLTEAFREARMYAAELNAIFPTGLNPVRKIVATDGAKTLVGHFDQIEPHIELDYEDFEPYAEKFAELYRFVGAEALEVAFADISGDLSPKKYFKPRRLLGGSSVQNEDVGQNTFGATISADLAHIFNPVSREDRSIIASEGYVTSTRRDRYVEPIDRVIRAANPAFSATVIEDTERPVEFLSKFHSERNLENQILLIIGGVGSGKTTFIDRLQEVSLSSAVREQTVWVHINMNVAPVSPDEIYDHLRREISAGLQSAYGSIDFEDLDVLKGLYSVEVNKFNKGRGKLFERDSARYNEELNDVIKNAERNLHLTALCHCRYLGTERRKLVVIVLDNCDKRTRNEQLLMFEVAQWLQREFRALTILPLREETYDNYRDRPPLDTALKDLVFRIEPPLFHQVLVKRVQLALNELTKSGAKKYYYDLPNGFRVEYPASDQAYYLTSIIASVFEHDRQIRRLISGLAGRNIRRAFEIFIEFCNSGHITEDHILRIRRSEGKYLLPLPLVLNVLLRNNRRYYDGDAAFVKNVADIEIRDVRPNYFSRLMVLRWLFSKASLSGPNGLKGFFPVSDIDTELSVYGLDSGVIRREVEYLVRAQCAISEDLSSDNISNETLIRLGPAGFVHLELIESAGYWSAVAEDTWFSDDKVARKIAERIGNETTHYTPQGVLASARDVLDFLEKVRAEEMKRSEALLERSNYGELTDLSPATGGLTKLLKTMTSGPWVDIHTRFKIGGVYQAIVVNIEDYGLFAEIEVGVAGLVHISRLPKGFSTMDKFGAGERINVKIIEIDPVRRRIPMAWVNDTI